MIYDNGLKMDDVFLRPYDLHDQVGFKKLVIDCHEEFGFAYYAKLDYDLDNPTRYYDEIWVLEQHDSVVGSVAIKVAEYPTAELKRMYIHPCLRGRGYGKLLLQTAIDAARKRKCQRIRLDTNAKQGAAQHIYETAGFQLVAKEGDEWFYELEL